MWFAIGMVFSRWFFTRQQREPRPSVESDAESDAEKSMEPLQELQLQITDKQLEVERQRKQSLEQRGITIITSSGAIATLIFAISTFVTKIANANNFVRSEAIPIELGVGAFFGAALMGLITNIPFRYGNLSAASLLNYYRRLSSKDGLTATPGKADTELRDSLIKANSEILRRTQRLNFYKSEVLLVGFAFEILGIGLLAWDGLAAGVVIRRHS
jgi:hypothetical protein